MAAKKSAADKQAEREAAFEGLRKVLKKHARSLVVENDTDKAYTLTSKQPDHKGKPLWFGGVALRKSYVSFHLFPVYVDPSLLKGMSAGLKKRMQGKSCFNFKAPDKQLFAELASLTKAGFDQWKADGRI